MSVLKGEQLQQRVKEVLADESSHEEGWMYLSFADETFKGAVIIKARGLASALTACTLLGINPGGQVLGDFIPPDVLLPDEKYRNRILTKEDVLEFWPDSKSLKEWDEDQKH